ncbi:hypothetical protein A8O16_25105 [Sphingobium sp. 20006FA]|nr:hypothetical protein A8O16_25105 [Sphingobium sp. 20006FA]
MVNRPITQIKLNDHQPIAIVTPFHDSTAPSTITFDYPITNLVFDTREIYLNSGRRALVLPLQRARIVFLLHDIRSLIAESAGGIFYRKCDAAADPTKQRKSGEHNTLC